MLIKLVHSELIHLLEGYDNTVPKDTPNGGEIYGLWEMLGLYALPGSTEDNQVVINNEQAMSNPETYMRVASVSPVIILESRTRQWSRGHTDTCFNLPPGLRGTTHPRSRTTWTALQWSSTLGGAHMGNSTRARMLQAVAETNS